MAHLSLNSPLGPLTLFEEDGSLVVLEWGRAPDGPSSPLLKEAKAQLGAYFSGALLSFELPLAPYGTPFQQAVWAAMIRIPYGRVQTYGELAKKIGSAPRAVGGACGRNPIPIIVPCHRVVSGNGPGGYSGAGGLDTKRILLRLEGYALD
ncbi:MAG: methylated-DNA--[protein]-cysteine S-methyltransferase [Rhodospirillales bacterium]|nr:methylated-DNA--[protein]-cysteine S-methyltransferase [Rhodospirillales bacterium]